MVIASLDSNGRDKLVGHVTSPLPQGKQSDRNPSNLSHLNTHQRARCFPPFREIYSRSFSRKIDKRSRIGCPSKIAHLLTVLRAKMEQEQSFQFTFEPLSQKPSTCIYHLSCSGVLNFAFEINSGKVRV